jgi:phage tail-like protein
MLVMKLFTTGLAVTAAFALLASVGMEATRAAEFTVNPDRHDPYKNFKFRIKWDGRYIAGISNISPLVRRTQVIEERAGGDPSSVRKSPGVTKFDEITLERGLTHDTAFEDWANNVWKFGAGLGSEVSLANFRKDVYLEVYNEAGQLAIAYKLYRCWPSEYEALPELDANKATEAIQELTLQCEGWERDTSVSEPKETQ